MINKLLYRASSNEKVKKEIQGKESRSQLIGGMYFDTSATVNGQPLLLPEESCLAEDENATFKVHCEKEGFHLFGRGTANVCNTRVKAYLTNMRVSPISEIAD
jgi:hypothetical protein